MWLQDMSSASFFIKVFKSAHQVWLLVELLPWWMWSQPGQLLDDHFPRQVEEVPTLLCSCRAC